MEKQRNFFLDLVRCFALFCIIWCHSNVVEFDSYLLEKVKWFFGKCGVPLFFIISGYLAFPLKMPLRIYLKGKFNRVVIPLIIWTIIYAVTEYVGNNPILLGGDILNEGSAHLWFIYVVMGLYLIVPLLNPFMAIVSRKVLKFYLLIWGVTTLYPLIIFVFKIPYSEHSCLYTLNSFYGYIGYFILGFYIRVYGSVSRLLKKKMIFSCIVASVILIGIYFFVFDCQTVIVSDHKGLPMLLYSIAMLGILAYIAPYVEKSRLRNGITQLSIYSFGIYLCHMLIVRYLYPYIPEISWMPDLLTTACVVIVNIAISYSVVRILSKMPFAHYLFG